MSYKKIINCKPVDIGPSISTNELVNSIHNDKKIEVSVLTSYPNYPEGKIYKGYENYLKKLYFYYSVIFNYSYYMYYFSVRFY